MLDFWALPGPKAVVDATWDSLRDGQSVVVFVPNSSVPDLTPLILDIARQEGYDGFRVEDNAEDVQSTLAHAAGVASGWTQASQPLTRYPEFIKPNLFIARVDELSWAKWRSFLEEYGREARNIDVLDRPRFLIIVIGAEFANGIGLGDGQLVLQRAWTHILGHLDTAVYIASRLAASGLSPLRLRLLTSAVTEVAKWDLELAELLSRLEVSDLTAPGDRLRGYARTKGWTSDSKPSWRDGSEEVYEGRLERHSAWLAIAQKDDEVLSRLWAAQAAVILPLIERERVRLAKEVLPYIRDGAGLSRAIERVLSLEIGPLCDELLEVRAPRRFIKRAKLLRSYRNKLAHLEIIPFEELWHSRLLSNDFSSGVENAYR